MVKKALQKLWTDTCSVYVQDKKKNESTKRTEFVEVALFKNQPCKLSFESLTTTTESNNAPVVTQGVKLFIDNELSIPSGSKIEVTRKNKTFVYKSSGEPGVFTYHQEINLELFEGWA